ncbi:hypothetical protein PspLS_11627 [Pyricularia sp. CBS 133598]|nr:hypothetical protein PspLS_11627 [Pyricularia sp. CBS 133598]
MSSPVSPADRNGFHIAIICALRIESDAVSLLFDEIFERQYGRENGDSNTYTTGRIGNHAVVLLLLPKIGMEAAAAGARSLQSSYINIKLALLVGVCGALPQISGRNAFLGDVIISKSIVNYDLGRQYPDKFVVRSTEDILGQPNNDIRGLLACLEGEYEFGRLQMSAVAKLASLQAKAIEEKRRTKYTIPPDDTDKMFPPDYKHMHYENDCDDCYAEPSRFCEAASKLSCIDSGCEASMSVWRQNRQQERPAKLVPQVFIGSIACGNAVMKSGEHRNAVAEEHKVIAFEMEGAGAWSEVPCIIVKGICDYADSHKNKQWQNFAAATAASVAVAILARYEVPGAITYRATAIPMQSALSLPPVGEETRNPVTHDYHHSGSGANFQGGNFHGHGNTFNFGEQREIPPKPCLMIPFGRDADFVNRKTLLDQVHHALSRPGSRAAFVGLGGVGKSQLAIEYCYRTNDAAIQKEPTWVFWIHTETRARVDEDLRFIADTVKIPGRGQPDTNIPLLLEQWLRNAENGRWLLILDNADNGDVFFDADHTSKSTTNATATASTKGRSLSSYLPQCSHGSILITSRKKEIAEKLTGDHKNIIEVHPMNEEHATELLQKKAGHQPDVENVARLVKVLEYMPLAVTQAGAYIRQRAPRTSVSKYLKDFEKSDRHKLSILNRDEGKDLRRDREASNSVIITWQISFEAIGSERQSAADLLSLMSFFDHQGIPESLVRPRDDNRSQDDNGGNHESDSNSSCASSKSDNWFEQSFEGDLEMLRDYSLVFLNDTGDVFRMHSLVQLATRRWLDTDEKLGTFKAQYINRIAGDFPTGHYNNWPTCQTLFAHVEKAISQRPQNDQPLQKWATVLYNGSWYAKEQGRYSLAATMAKKSREARQITLGNSHELTLDSILMVGLILLNQGKYKNAEKLFVEVMEIREKKLGLNHPDTLSSMANLASAYRNQGRWEEAEQLEVEVMETSKEKLGLDHPDTLSSMANLASTYWNQGRWKEAEQLFVEVMETRKKKLGLDHPDTLSSMANLASTYWNQGRWEEAEQLEVEIMETRKEKLGLDHILVTSCSTNSSHAKQEWGSLQ